MREIKFRVWHKKDKVMVDVASINFWPNGVLSVLEDFDDAEPQFADSYELMEYTGLKDKNGKDIFEGDIVRYTAWHDGKPAGAIQGEVVYSGDLGMVSFDIRLDHDGEIDRAVLPAMGVEIIGNAFENPELLEVEK